MTDTETAAPERIPSLREQIRAILPDHTRTDGGGILAPDVTFRWTTSGALWTVRIPGGPFNFAPPRVAVAAEPGGKWTLDGGRETILRRLTAMLCALDAIEDPGGTT